MKILQREVSSAEFLNAAVELYSFLQGGGLQFVSPLEVFPLSVSTSLILPPEIPEPAQPVVAWLLLREFLLEEAAAQKLTVSDEEVEAELLRPSLPYRPVFEADGQFSREELEKFLAELGWNSEDYREEIRRHLLVRKITQKMIGGVEAPEEVVRKLFEEGQTRVDLEFLQVLIEPWRNKVSVSKEEIKAFASSRSEELRAYYDKNEEEFGARIRARHLLLRIPPGASSAEEAKAQEGLQKIQTRLQEGADFADLATEFSEDPGSAANGGDLGWFGKGEMVPEFEKAAFSLKPGEISPPVRTQFGLHLIKVEERKDEQPFEDVANTLAEELLREEKADSEAKKQAEALLAKTKKLKPGDSLEKLLTKPRKNQKEDPFAPRFQTTEDLSQAAAKEGNIPGLGNSPALAKEAFLLSKEKPIASQVFSVEDNNGGSYVIMRLTQRTEPDLETYKEVQEDLRASYILSQQAQILLKWMTDQTPRFQSALEVNTSVIKSILELP